MRHPQNRKERQRNDALKDKRKRRLCEIVNYFRSFYLDDEKDRVCHLKWDEKKYLKRCANRKARRDYDYGTNGNSYRKSYDLKWKLL